MILNGINMNKSQRDITAMFLVSTVHLQSGWKNSTQKTKIAYNLSNKIQRSRKKKLSIYNNIVTKCLKAGIEESLPRQRIETTASIASQRLGEPLIAAMILVA
jgi:hypothetical protein